MTRSSHQFVEYANGLAEDLLSALESRSYAQALPLADKVRTLGVQSLDQLTPRGTLEFPAANRWEARLTRELLDQLNSPDLPEPLTATILNALGQWAGEDAVAGIHQLLVGRLRERESSAGTAEIIRNGLYALHLIGGPQAVEVLSEFQGPDFPPQTRAQASHYLNELGGCIVDLMFGSESSTPMGSAADGRAEI
jgi:hypothetical protein